MKRYGKKSYTGTEREASVSRLIESLGGGGFGGGGKIGFKYKPSSKGATNISGPTQKGGKVPQSAPTGVLSQKQKINFLMTKGFNKILGLFATAGATKALNKRKEDKKKRVGRTILTSP